MSFGSPRAADFINPDYFAAIDWPGGVEVVTGGVVIRLLLFCTMDSVDGIVQATRKRRTR